MSEVGSPVPVVANPTDFVLNTVNADFVSSDVVEAVLERWAAREPRNVDLVATRGPVASISWFLQLCLQPPWCAAPHARHAEALAEAHRPAPDGHGSALPVLVLPGPRE